MNIYIGQLTSWSNKRANIIKLPWKGDTRPTTTKFCLDDIALIKLSSPHISCALGRGDGDQAHPVETASSFSKTRRIDTWNPEADEPATHPCVARPSPQLCKSAGIEQRTRQHEKNAIYILRKYACHRDVNNCMAMQVAAAAKGAFATGKERRNQGIKKMQSRTKVRRNP